MRNVRTLLLFLIALSLLPGCSKDTSFEVTIVLQGDEVTRHVLNQPYTDGGAYGVDHNNKRLEVTVDIKDVNINKAGCYKVKYSAEDEHGNKGTAERTVVVYNELEYLNGNWLFYKYPQGATTPDTIYIETLLASDTLNRQFTFERFSNYDHAPVKAHLFASLITIDSLQYFIGPTESIDTHFYGEGLQMTDNRLEINYGEIINAHTTLYTAAIVRQ